jgi:hypothetical protein
MTVLRRLNLLVALAMCVLAPTALGATAARRAPTLPISLTNSLNATCTAPQGNQVYLLTGCLPGNGTTFVAESMPGPGLLDVRGITFRWPGQSDFYFPPGSSGTRRLDSVVNPTAPVALGGHGGYRYVALLVAGFGDQFKTPYTVTYTDGTSVSRPLWIRDWAAPQGESDIPGIRLQQGTNNVEPALGKGAIKTLLVDVDPRKRLRSITLAPSTLTYAVSLTNTVPTGAGPIDGPHYSPAPSERLYGRSGPWSVTVSRTPDACDRDGALCTLYSPSPLGRDPRTGQQSRHPLIAWANGSGQATSQYDHYLRQLASWGFLVISTDDTGTGDGGTVTDTANYVLTRAKDPRSPWHTTVDARHVGVAGHSQGGGAVMGLFARQTPPFSAYVAVHPSPAYFCYAACNYKPGDLANGKHGAILYLQSADDGGAGDTENYYNQTPDSAVKAFGVVAHAKHDDVMGTPHCISTNCITGSYAYLGYSTEWFLWHLQQETALRSVFSNDTGEFLQSDSDWKLTRSNVR